MLTSVRARSRSAAMSSRRLSRWWSAQAPTISDTRFGAHTAAVSRPIWVGVACRDTTAISGNASSVTRSPNCETLSPLQ